MWHEHEATGCMAHWATDIDALVRKVKAFMEGAPRGKRAKALPTRGKGKSRRCKPLPRSRVG
jgi:hypothetical protein